MIEYSIDPMTWYSEREMKFCPLHFVIATTPLTYESKQWVFAKLTGRFAIVPAIDKTVFLSDFLGRIAFEDPREATLYELKWS